MMLDLDGNAGGVSAGGVVLDGDWNNPVGITPGGDAYPSGDGSPGGNFLLH